LGWRTSTPEEQGIDSAMLAESLLAMREKGIFIHSLMMIRNGRAVVDAVFYPYDSQTVHELASVTKSVMTTLIGIAADQGALKLDQPMLDFFPGRTIANLDERKKRITLRHLASMSSGLDCTSEGDEATHQEMKLQPDWTQFALDRKVPWEPGEHFVYCSPAIHLLSPILQQATGMKALDFAKKYLLQPLGIQETHWLTDPQGANRGSEGIYLRTQDLAKIGFLWLHKGMWEGKQIVSSKWVEESVKAHMITGEGDDYGYGWWVPNDSPAPGVYTAIGRGGQRVIVVPGWNLIVATTGGGFDFDEIDALLVAALVDMEKPLPPNPEGVKQLEAAVKAVAQVPEPQAVAPLPEIAKNISGKTLLFDPNPAEIEDINVTFDDSAEAIMRITFSGEPTETWPIGLDGVFRMSQGDFGLPQGLRGSWIDDQTFAFEYDNIANNDHGFYRLTFQDGQVVFEGQETAHEGGVKFEGRIRP
jgi:CubicO group peptidase (beta-lactamase class C family)